MRRRLDGGYGWAMARSDGFHTDTSANYLFGRCYSQTQSHTYHRVIAYVGNYHVPHPNNVPRIQSIVMLRFGPVRTARGTYPPKCHGWGYIPL